MLTEKLKELWRGEIPLAKTFWLCYVAVFLIVGLIFHLFCLEWIVYSILLGEPTPLYLTTLFALFVLLPYQIVVLVGLWRSSSLYEGSKIWRILAKAVVVLSAINIPKAALDLLDVFGF